MLFYYTMVGENGLESVGSEFSGFIRGYASFRTLRRYRITDAHIRQLFGSYASRYGVAAKALRLYSAPESRRFDESCYTLIAEYED